MPHAMPTAANPAIAPWSTEEYRAIIRKYKPLIKDYRDIHAASDDFCLIRHDVEFSVSRALMLAEIDHQEGITSSFFIQVSNNAYNPLSTTNHAMIQRIAALGHHIGLHFYVSHLSEQSPAVLKEELMRQIQILEFATQVPVDRFSYHRPPRWVLELPRFHDDHIINAYDPLYFELTAPGADAQHIKYMADSQHKWHYGHPLDTHAHQQFQILLHPDEWTPTGLDVRENFEDLIATDTKEFVECIRSECKHYDLIMKP